jgi:hypothetical protein
MAKRNSRASYMQKYRAKQKKKVISAPISPEFRYWTNAEAWLFGEGVKNCGTCDRRDRPDYHEYRCKNDQSRGRCEHWDGDGWQDIDKNYCSYGPEGFVSVGPTHGPFIEKDPALGLEMFNRCTSEKSEEQFAGLTPCGSKALDESETDDWLEYYTRREAVA